MSRRLVVLNLARHDFREIKAYIRSQFGEAVWAEINVEFKHTVSHIGLHPAAGSEIAELREMGLDNFRTRLVRQTRIVYEFDDKEVVVHMFLPTKRDFRAQLLQRLFQV